MAFPRRKGVPRLGERIDSPRIRASEARPDPGLDPIARRGRDAVIGAAVGFLIGTVLALIGVEELIEGHLGLLGVFIPPLGGALIGD